MTRRISVPLLAGWRTALGLFVALIVFLVPLVVLPHGRAEASQTETFEVEPSPLRTGDGEIRRKFVYSLEPGNTITDAIRVTNKTDDERRFRVYAADAHEDAATGAVKVEAYSATTDGVGSWIEVENEELLLGPRATEVVRFSVLKPDGPQPEGLGAVVVEEVKDPSAQAGIDIVYRLALTVRTTGAQERLHVGEPDLTVPVALIPGRGRASVELRNETLRPLSTVVDLTVEGLTGTRWELEPVAVELAAGASEVVEANWTSIPRWGGLFRVRAEATWDAGTVASAGPRAVYPPLWLLAVAIVALGLRSSRELWKRRHEQRQRTATEPAPDVDDVSSARLAAGDFDAWYREQRDDPRVREPVGS